ncbi:MAG: 30S ribosomal protein S16 [Patescibacteria group bacterium]|nr:30S ribosomal protein S16 [Patescibacteria group bacterium]
MLAIRLSRVGKKKYATFKVIVSEKTKDTVGDYLELLGNYNPHTNEASLKADRIRYWISKGAQPSGSIHNLLIQHNVIEGKKIKVANIKKKEQEGAAAGSAEAPA